MHCASQCDRHLWHCCCAGSSCSDNAKYPGIIKTGSAPMFSRMYCRDVKWIFYIYSLNRRCVLVGQPCYAVAKQPEAHMHKAHVLCDAQAELYGHLHCSWHTAALPEAAWVQGPHLHLTESLLAKLLTTQPPKHSQGTSLCMDLPPP